MRLGRCVYICPFIKDLSFLGQLSIRRVYLSRDVLHPEEKQQTTPAAPRDALDCVAALGPARAKAGAGFITPVLSPFVLGFTK